MISAAIEAEIALLESADDKVEFLETLGLEETGLSKVIAAGYKVLDLVTFLTTGPKESRAWTVPQGATAPQAAGVIHSDFEKGFYVDDKSIRPSEFLQLSYQEIKKIVDI